MVVAYQILLIHPIILTHLFSLCLSLLVFLSSVESDDVEPPGTEDNKPVEVGGKQKKSKRPKSRIFLRSKRNKSSNSSQSETEAGKEEVPPLSAPAEASSEKEPETMATPAAAEEDTAENTTVESGVEIEAEQKEVKGQPDGCGGEDEEEVATSKDGEDEADSKSEDVLEKQEKVGRTVAIKSEGDVEDPEEEEVFPDDPVSGGEPSEERKSQTLPASASSSAIAPTSPTCKETKSGIDGIRDRMNNKYICGYILKITTCTVQYKRVRQLLVCHSIHIVKQ